MSRLFDLIISTIAILLLSPLLITVMFILIITGEHEVFYPQKRVGKNKKVFKVLKFATMKKNSETMVGGTVTKKNDPRVLPFGKVLRKTKINEIPQIFNIWVGQMSFVGPRPLTPDQFYNYSKEQQSIISKLTPGLTGIGSLIFRDEESIMEKSGMDYNEIHDTIIAEYKGDLECWFYENNHIRNYIKIFILTIVAVVSPKEKFLNRFKGLPKPKGVLSELL